MRAVVVYESMYGNTRRVAEAIARGLAGRAEVAVVPVAEAGGGAVAGADLVVVGGPTHAHGMSRSTTRAAAVDQAKGDAVVEPAADGPGLREWFDAMGRARALSAAFDTRAGVAPALLTGRASTGIAKRLRQHGFGQLVAPESFLVDKENHLQAGEEERAEAWGVGLAEAARG
jgi:hypothetical protein